MNDPLASFTAVREQLETIARIGGIAFSIYDEETGQVTVSEGYRDILGIDPGAPIPLAELRQFGHPDDREATRAHYERGIAAGKPFAIEHRMVARDGRVVWVRRDLMPKYAADGRYVGYLAVIHDITEQRRAEAALRARERELSAILDNAPVAIFLKDRARRFRLVNRRYEEWFGKQLAAVVGRNDGEVYDTAFAALVEASDRKVLAGEVVSDERPAVSVETRHSDIRHVSVTKFPIRDAAGAVEGICGFVRDITDRKEAEDALRISETRFRALIEHSSDVTCVFAPDGTIRYMSPSTRDILGRDPAARVGRPILEFVAVDDQRRLADALADLRRAPHRRVSGETRLQHADGSMRQIAWTARNAADVPGIEGIIVNARDVTEGRELAEQLAQAQKMEAVGQLASGIAHDFNNIMGAILGFAGFLVEDLAPGSEQHRFATRIVQAGTRAREVVQQILTFARRTGVERRDQDLRPIVGEALELLRASLPSSTQVSAAIAGAPLVATVGATQISQVLLNLCMNAHDAAGGEPATIAITLERVAPGDAELPGAHDGRQRARIVQGTLDPACAYARLAVADEGAGMDEAVLQRVFEPFFTTKPRGRGTGLGLPVVHGIAAAHGGACVVESAPGQGTTVALFIPLATSAAAAGAEPEHAERLAGRERILVVDDDADIIDVVTTGLDRLGYEAVGVADATEALAAYRADPAAWDVVISDQVMPRMKGLALLAQLRALNPKARFILCTGFSDSASERVAREAGVDGYFLKPVPIGQLAAAIRALCDGPG
jgi:PAS domain S-box-containing protein